MLDKINEAYYATPPAGEVNKQRERIHWLCAQASGKRILDIGCSQGITSILLGREGKEVLGIDIAKESIKYANEALANEAESTKKRVTFQCMDIFSHTISQRFDTVIISEVLEHFSHPEELVSIAAKLVVPAGKLICMTPFGINDFPDHKKTFYMYDVIKILENYFEVQSHALIGKWLGIVCHEGKGNKKTIDFNAHIKTCEEYFYRIERDYVNSISTKNNLLKVREKNYEKQVATLREDIALAKEANVKLKESYEIEQKKYIAIEMQLQTKNDRLEEVNEVYEQARKEIISLVECIEKERRAYENALEKIVFEEKQNEEIRQAFHQAEESIASLKETLEVERYHFKNLSQEKEELSEQVEILKNTLNQVNSEKTELLEQLTEMEDTHNQTNIQIAALQQNIFEYENVIKEKKECIEKEHFAHIETEEKKVAIEKQYEELSLAYHQAGELITSLEEELDKKAHHVEELCQDRMGFVSQIETLETSLYHVNAEKTDLLRQYIELEMALRITNSEKTDLVKQYTELETALGATNAEKAELLGQLTGMEAVLGQAKALVRTMQYDISKLDDLVKKKEDTIKKNEQTIKEREEIIKNSEQVIKERADTIREIEIFLEQRTHEKGDLIFRFTEDRLWKGLGRVLIAHIRRICKRWSRNNE